ncbi:ATP-binding protein [Dysgonomonas sp. ZJ709]|uniref:ATP-binding protein n=1 Tax=Dysgonomonas sp. ZJ709 TaxID=2709797 RepID=UPI0013EA8F92|nr:ATP-binding protein [Dysgonomonas sp. ZJ709]
MVAVIFCGIQATGKSSFYKQNFFKTHVHISMDLLKTRNRENRFIDLCLETEQSFLIDNTNPSRNDRGKYIEKIREKRDCKLICYYFQSKIEDALNRNTERIGKERIPDVGIKATFNKLELPSFDEGFDEIYYVELIENKFIIKNWEI